MFIVHFFFFSAEWDLRNRQEGPYLSLCLLIRIDTCNHTWKVARWAFFPPWTCQYRRWPVSGGNRNHVRCAANTGDRVVYLNTLPIRRKQVNQSCWSAKFFILEVPFFSGNYFPFQYWKWINTSWFVAKPPQAPTSHFTHAKVRWQIAISI